MATSKKSSRNRPAVAEVARIEPDPLRRRNTSIALEEVKRGLVPFTIFDPNLVTDQVAE
jgi:DNA-directed RNA polymerase subunit K/omega